MDGAAVAPKPRSEAADVKHAPAVAGIADRTSFQSRMRIAELKARIAGTDAKLVDSIRAEIIAIERQEDAREHMDVLACMRRVVKTCGKTVFLVDPLRLGLKMDSPKGKFVAINPESERVARGINNEFNVLPTTVSATQFYIARRRKGDIHGNIDVFCDGLFINCPLRLTGWRHDATTACNIPDDQADAADFGETDFETDDEDEHYQSASKQFPVVQHLLFLVPVERDKPILSITRL